MRSLSKFEVYIVQVRGGSRRFAEFAFRTIFQTINGVRGSLFVVRGSWFVGRGSISPTLYGHSSPIYTVWYLWYGTYVMVSYHTHHIILHFDSLL